MMARERGQPGWGLNGAPGRREYNGQTEERKVYKFPPGFDFVPNFANRTTTDNMRNSRHGVSIPPPKKGKAEPWTPEDLELYRKHFDMEDMIMLGPDSTSVPAAPYHIAQKRSAPASKAWNEEVVKSEALSGAKRQPPELSAEDSRKAAGEDNDRQFQMEETGKSGTMLETDDNANRPVGFAPEPRIPNIEDQLGSSMENALNDSEEPQLVPTTHVQVDSHQPESISIHHGKKDVHEEGELSFPIDMDPAAFDHEQEEELERAMQHFNLGMWHKPWRPHRQVSQIEEKKEAARDLSKQLELQKEQVEFNPTIHVLGMGTAGKYIAHSLAGLPNGPPVTLLMHRPLHMQIWHDEGAAIKILTNGEYHVQRGFHIESCALFQREDPSQQFPGFGPNLEHSAEPPNTVIENLIVTTDMSTTLSALSRIKHRLRKSTTICLFHDGLGIIEKINETFFPEPHDRPTYVMGRMSHDLKSTHRHFTIVENEPGKILLTKLAKAAEIQRDSSMPLVRRMDSNWSPQASHLIHHLARAPELNVKGFDQQTFFISQLEQLVIGAVIGPLSVAFDCSNDQLLYNFHIAQYIRSLLHETTEIIKSFPEFATTQKFEQTFRVNKMEARIISCLKQSGKNVSHMLQDVRAGRKTDIDFYTGYLVTRAKELGIECPINHMLLYLVKGRQGIKSREKNSYVPFEDGK
jgi:2-dehydropantoate 2-reductase